MLFRSVASSPPQPQPSQHETQVAASAYRFIRRFIAFEMYTTAGNQMPWYHDGTEWRRHTVDTADAADTRARDDDDDDGDDDDDDDDGDD